MKNTKTIEEQVSELTEAQKETILKVDKYGTILLLVLTVPGLLLLCLGLLFMATDSSFMSEEAYRGFQILGIIVLLIAMGILVFIKIKFPYYSDKKAAFIRKSRKNK